MPPEQHRATGSAGSGDMGVGGFVTGLLSLLLGWLIPVVGIVFGALGVVLGGLGRSRGRRDGVPSGLATAGVVLGGIGVAVAVVVGIAVVARS